MNQEQARNLVHQTLTGAFDKARFRNFVLELLNEFDESKAFISNKTYIKDAFKHHVERFERLGTYTSSDDEKLDVLIVHLTKQSKLERARTAIRNFVADHLKQRDGKDAALVAFVSPTEKQWRFSYVKMEYAAVEKDSGKIGVETKLTPARRFSYIVGEGESCHTAQTRFLGLLQDTETAPTLAQLEEAFSVDAVTKEFFRKYADLFGEIQKALDKLARKDSAITKEFDRKNVRTADFAKKLMGQIVFLYFIQKKGWLGVEKGKDWGTGPHDFLRRLARGDYGKYENFFNDILEPLFYDTLATDRGHEASCKRFNCRIPFLNGGLFEPLADYDWRKTDIVLPNRLFTNNERFDDFSTGTGLLDMFDRYNFTVNEAEPLEKEVAIDPEMLGKVFENLIEENLRKGLGSYYTPREIVHYMCQESLINYLDTALNSAAETIGREKRKQAEFGDEKSEQTLLVAPARREVVSRDDIETFVHLGDQISHYESVETRYAIKMPKSIEKNARLIDERLADITICDPAVGSGAFPVGMMSEIVRARSALTPYFNDVHDRTPYHFKRHAIQNCLYGVDIDPGAVEIAKLRLWLSLVVDEEDVKQIKPLPNLFYKIVTGNSLLGVDKDELENWKAIRRLEELKPRYFDEPDKEKKLRYKQQIDDTIHGLTNGKETFDFEIYFSEIFHQKQGFDVVIANPPYLKERDNAHVFAPVNNTPWGKKHHQGKMDYWFYFLHRAIDISRPRSGLICFITSRYWINSQGAKKLIKRVKEELSFTTIVDIGELKVFQAVAGYHMVALYSKWRSSDEFTLLRLRDDVSHLADSNSSQFVERRKLRNSSVITDDFEIVLGDGRTTVRDCTRLGDLCDISQGVVEAPDKLSKRHIEQFPRKRMTLGQGVFVLTSAEVSRLALNSAENSILKPYLDPHDVRRYAITDRAKKFLIYSDRENIELIRKDAQFRHLRKHLDQFSDIITSSNGPYGLHRPRDARVFEKDKILFPSMFRDTCFALDTEKRYVGMSFSVVVTRQSDADLRFILGLLNSKWALKWYFDNGKHRGAGVDIGVEKLRSFPVPLRQSSHRSRISKIVDRIIAAKQRNPEADTSALEREIDQLVYELYGPTPEEIKIVEDATK